jgi:Ser/Thr protein kinase RdoA (MazF antagonist)
VGRPIGYLSHFHALALEEAPGASLQEILLQEADTVAAMRRVAQALAAFHQADVAMTRHHALKDRLDELKKATNLLQWVCPHLRAEVLGVAGAVTAGLEEVPPRPTHRDLKVDHLFLDGDRVVFIDLGSFAAADPVLDPALLLAHLAAIPSRATVACQFSVPQDRVRTAARTFAEEYFTHAPRAWRSRLPAQYAGALLEVAASFFRHQEPRWPDKVAALLEEARDSLAGRVW